MLDAVATLEVKPGRPLTRTSRIRVTCTTNPLTLSMRPNDEGGRGRDPELLEEPDLERESGGGRGEHEGDELDGVLQHEHRDVPQPRGRRSERRAGERHLDER